MPKQWFLQADSDLRVAKALKQAPPPMEASDVGCHVTAMCAQTLEKSLKGCFIIVGMRRGNDHRPDKSIKALLLMSPKRHRKHLNRLFDIQTRRAIEELLALTPGGQDNKNVPNTEYPWKVDNVDYAPAAHPMFDRHVDAWLKLAGHVHSKLEKIWSAERRARVGMTP